VPDESSSRGPVARRSIVIADDHPLVRRGLTALIDAEPDLTVRAAVATHQEGLEAIASSCPDLVITEFSLGDGEGLALVKAIRRDHGSVPVLVLTRHDAPVYSERAFRAGASGYVTKRELGETLLVAIRRVLDGESWASPGLGEGTSRP